MLRKTTSIAYIDQDPYVAIFLPGRLLHSMTDSHTAESFLQVFLREGLLLCKSM